MFPYRVRVLVLVVQSLASLGIEPLRLDRIIVCLAAGDMGDGGSDFTATRYNLCAP